MEKQPKIFTDGLIFKKPRQGAPDFVKGAISVKVAEFTAFLKKHDNNGWVNIDLKQSKEGKLYCELNNFRRDVPTEPQAEFKSTLTDEEKEAILAYRNAKTKKVDNFGDGQDDGTGITF